MSNPRVLLGVDYFARYAAGLAAGLDANDCPSAFLYHVHDHAFGGVPGALDRHLAATLPAGVRRLPVPGRVRDLQAIRPMVRSARAARRWSPDVVHLQACVASDPRLVLAAPLRRGAFALTLHDLDLHPGDAAPPTYKLALVRWLARNAGLLFVHAERLREQLLREEGVRAPVVVVPHGVEQSDLGPLPQRPRLLLFGRLSTYKGVDVLLDAMPRVWAKNPEVEVTIAGEGPLPTHPALEDARVTVIQHHVPDDEVPELFRVSSLVVLPYLEASQSGVGSLAKGYGRPLLASSIGGLTELLADGSGELVPPGDPEALADRVLALVDDRAALERHADAARRSAAASSGWVAVAAQTIAAYEQHLPARRGT